MLVKQVPLEMLAILVSEELVGPGVTRESLVIVDFKVTLAMMAMLGQLVLMDYQAQLEPGDHREKPDLKVPQDSQDLMD